MKLARTVVSDKQGFLKYINSKRRSKENIGLIFVVNDHLTNWCEEKVEAFSTFFCLDLIIILTNLGLLCPLIWRTIIVGIVTLFVYMEIVRHQLNVFKSMRPGGIHPRVLKELVLL